MSYQPIPKDEEGPKVKKHRNPIYPSLKYPQPEPIHTLGIFKNNHRVINHILPLFSATYLFQLLLLLYILLSLHCQSNT